MKKLTCYIPIPLTSHISILVIARLILFLSAVILPTQLFAALSYNVENAPIGYVTKNERGVAIVCLKITRSAAPDTVDSITVKNTGSVPSSQILSVSVSASTSDTLWEYNSDESSVGSTESFEAGVDTVTITGIGTDPTTDGTYFFVIYKLASDVTDGATVDAEITQVNGTLVGPYDSPGSRTVDGLGWLKNQVGTWAPDDNTRLIDSFEGDGTDKGWTYDQGLAAIAFTVGGDTHTAKKILNGMKIKQNSDGSWYRCYDTSDGSVVNTDKMAGHNAWMVQACNIYRSRTGQTDFDDMAERCLDYLKSYQDTNASNKTYGGIKMIGGGNPEVVATENNISLYPAFYYRYLINGSTGYLTSANLIKDYLLNEIWNDTGKYFWAGYNEYGANPTLDETVYLDNQSWGNLCFADHNGHGPGGENLAGALTYAYDNIRITDTYVNGDVTVTDIQGFDEYDKATLDRIWFEGTNSMVAAYYWVCSTDTADSFHYQSTRAKDASTTTVTAAGVPYYTPPGNVDRCVASTAWHFLNSIKYNPFRPPSPDTTSPAEPTNISAIFQGTGRIEVSWTEISESTVTYHIYASTYGEITDVTLSTVTYLGSVSEDTTYYTHWIDETDSYWYAVTAKDKYQNEDIYPTADGNATTSAVSGSKDTTAPQEPTGIGVNNSTVGTNVITWTDCNETEGITYKIYYSTEGAIANVTAAKLLVSGISPGTESYNHSIIFESDYYYAVTSIDYFGNEDTSPTADGNATSGSYHNIQGTIIDGYETEDATYTNPWNDTGCSTIISTTTAVKRDGNRSLKLEYTIDAGDDWGWSVTRTQFASSFDARNYREIQFWVRGGNPNQKFNLEVVEDNTIGDGETWKYSLDGDNNVALPGGDTWKLVSIPLGQGKGAFRDGDTGSGNGIFTPVLAEYHFVIEGSVTGSATAYFDTLKVLEKDSVIDEYERYNDNAVQTGSGDGTISVAMSTDTYYEGSASMQVSYNLTLTSGYVYATKFIRPWDASSYDGLEFWLKGDGSENELKVSLSSAVDAGNNFESPEITLRETGWNRVFINFKDFYYSGLPPEDSQLQNLSAISYTISGSSTGVDYSIYFDITKFSSPWLSPPIISDFEDKLDFYKYWANNGGTIKSENLQDATAVNGSNSMKITYTLGSGANSYAKTQRTIYSPTDFSAYKEIQFYVKGDGSANELKLELQESEVYPADGEIWETKPAALTDSTTYQMFLVPLVKGAGTFIDSNGSSVGNNVFDLTSIARFSTVIIGADTTSNLTCYVDYLKLVDYGTVIDAFNHINAPYNSGSDAGSTVALEISSSTVQEGYGALKIDYDLDTSTGYVWITKEIEQQDWSAQNQIKFYLKGDGSANALRVKVTMGGTLFSKPNIPLSDDSWHQVTVPFGDLLDDSNCFPTETQQKYVTNLVFYIDGSNTDANIFYLDDIQISYGSPVATLSTAIKNISDNAPNYQLNWSTITVDVSTWVVSEQYVEVTYDANQTGWGVRVYTDNKAADADPKATGATDDDITGLIGSVTTEKNAALSWEVFDDTTSVTAAVPAVGNDWLWLKDKSQSDWANIGDQLDYTTIVNVTGIKHKLSRDPGSSPIYVYFEGNFSNSEIQQYKTNKLYFVLYHQ